MKEIEKLAKKLGYTILYNQQHSYEPLINDCNIAGNEIFIGDYEDDELMLISFFHEHGHMLIDSDFIKKCNYNTFMIEIEAWNCGIKFAMNMGYYFTDDAIKWAYSEKAMSYSGHDERECSNWETDHKPTLWKYKHDKI